VRIVSVNVGLPRDLPDGDGVVASAIVKEPVAGPVPVGRTNLAGDAQADLTVHGGVDKAVYAYPHEHYAAWRRELGRADLEPGHFGENLTVEGLLEEEVGIGDVFRVGSALLQVSQPRVPCFKLAIRMGDPAFARPFLRSGRVGFYLRVLDEGVVRAGDPITRRAAADPSMTVREVAALLGNGASADELDRGAALASLPLSWREAFAHRAVAARRRR
jgi:MOSC domain-containing protein YiiM